MKKKKVLLGILVATSVIALASCSGKKKKAETTEPDYTKTDLVVTEFKVTFLNYDGSELYSYTAKKGDIAKYSGQTPERIGDYYASYVFSGWDKPLAEVTENVIYTATYKVEYSTTYYSNGLLFELSKDQKGWYIRKYVGQEENVVIPSTFDGLPVTTILSGAFSNNEFVKSIHIGEYVQYIGENAFLNMKSMEQITVSENNKIFFVRNDALIGVYNDPTGNYTVKSLIYIPSTKTGFYEIPDDVSVYRGCLSGSRLNDLKFSANVFKPINDENNIIADAMNNQYSRYVYKDLFGGTEQDVNNSEIIHVIVSGGDIPAGMFANVTKLESISMYENELHPITEIGSLAFYGCTGLKSMVIPNSVETIRKKAFQNCNFKTLHIGADSELKLKVVEDHGLDCTVDKTVLDNGLEYVGNDENPFVLAYSIDSNNTRTQDSVTLNRNTLFLKDGLLQDTYYAGGVTTFNVNNAKLRSLGANSLFYLKKKITLPSTVNYIGDTPVQDITVFNVDNNVRYILDENDDKYVIGMSSAGTFALNSTYKFITSNAFGMITAINQMASNANYKYLTVDKALYTKDYRTLLYCNTTNAELTLNEATKNIGQNAFNSSDLKTIYAYDIEFIDTNAFTKLTTTDVLELKFKYADGELIENRFNNIVYLSNSLFNTTLASIKIGNKLGYLENIDSTKTVNFDILENDDYSIIGANADKLKYDYTDGFSYYEKVYSKLGLIDENVRDTDEN